MEVNPRHEAIEACAELVVSSMERLSQERPVFYSEADFQHAMAWDLHQADPGAQLRLETPLASTGRAYLDLFVATGGWRFAIELKYPP